jgi:hypothetical protein
MKVIEVFNALPQPIRDRAILNSKKRELNDECENLREAISSSFAWADTPEGGEFWTAVWQTLYNYETDMQDIVNQLAPTKKYTNVYKDSIDFFADERMYDTKEQAEDFGKVCEHYYKTIEVEL